MYVCMYVSNVGYSTSIFQILFTDIHIRHSFVYSICVASQSNILVSLSFTSQSWSQHPYFKIQYSTSLIQHYALTIQHIHFKYYSHSTFVCVFYLNLCSIECLVCVCVVVQSAICLQRNHQHSCLDIELSFSRVAPSVTRVCAFCGLCPVYDDLTDVYDDLTDVITLY